MKIGIIGASGLVGHSLFNTLSAYFGRPNVIGTYNNHPFEGGVALNITKRNQLKIFINKNMPDIIIWLAGSKNIEQLEINPELSHLINEKPVLDLLSVLEEEPRITKLIYISSDYVFDGKKGGYQTTDVCEPDTVYGKSKLYCEGAILNSKIEAVCVRTSAIMNPQGGFMAWLINNVKEGKTIGLYSNTIFSPTTHTSFNKAICRIIEGSYWDTRVLHFAGNPITRYEFGILVLKYIKINESLIYPSIADTKRTKFHKNLSLKTSKVLLDLTPSNDDLNADLIKYKQYYD